MRLVRTTRAGSPPPTAPRPQLRGSGLRGCPPPPNVQDLGAAHGPVEVTVLAQKDLDFDVEVSVLIELEKRHARVSKKHLGVSARGGS